MKASKRLLLIGLMIITGASFSACDRKSGNDALDTDALAAGPTTAKGDEFGKEFGAAYRANPNSEPRVIDKNELQPVSYTSEPVEFD